jgi:probable addiction module antidote protein
VTKLVCEFKVELHCKFTPQALWPYIQEYGVRKLAREIGVSREGLYKSFSVKGNPRMRTVFAVLNKLNLHTCFGIIERDEAAGLTKEGK